MVSLLSYETCTKTNLILQTVMVLTANVSKERQLKEVS